MRKKRGFTLIELLVVIAIIAILAAILFPVFARAREKARTASCQSNVKQLALGVLMYVNDYDEALPMCYSLSGTNGTASWPLKLWFMDTQPYTKNWQILKCPSTSSSRTGRLVGSGNSSRVPEVYSDYHANNWVLSATRTTVNNAMATLSHPAETIMLFDTGFDARWCGRMAQTWWGAPRENCYAIPAMDETQLLGGASRANRDRHSGGYNASFNDGHVKFLQPAQTGIGQATYDRFWRKTR